MKNKFTVDNTSSEEELLQLLSLDEGIDLQNWTYKGRKARKSLQKLILEIRDRDVSLIWNPETGRVERHAQIIKILMRNPELMLVWLEVGRRYPEGEPLIYGGDDSLLSLLALPDWSVRGTRRRGELAWDAAWREMGEELADLFKKLDRWPVPSDLVEMKLFPLKGNTWGPGADEPDKHESTVYPLLTKNSTSFFELTLPWLPGEDILILDTGGLEVTNDNWVESILKCSSCR